MTKFPERGENDISREARRQALRTGKDVCAILAQWLAEAKRRRDQDRIAKIQGAQKYLRCRNVRKRRKKS